MTIAAIDARTPATPRGALSVVPLWAWWLLAVLATTGLALFAKGAGRTFEFIDSDDALRFIHVRELLAGAPWFEIKTQALGGAEGLLSHWSRLIDGPMALLLGLFRLVLPETIARDAVVTVWPVLFLGATLWAIARTTQKVAGDNAALLALVFASTSLLAYYQFAPGRIDHHNVMIATTMAATLIVWAWPDNVRMWRWAGALCGIALAIGYEALAPVALIAALVASWGLIDRRQAEPAAAFVIGLVATLAVVLAVTVAPSRWLTSYCDALSLNLVMLGICAGAGFVAVMRYGDWSWPVRIAVLGVSGAVGIAAYGWLEPACLAGPMGQVPQELGPIWMDEVYEAKSVLRELLRGDLGGIGTLMILATGLCVGIVALGTSSRPADRFYLLVAAGFVVLALWQMKYVAYASLLLVPGLAVLVARLPAIGSVSAALITTGAVLALNQFMLLSLALAFKAAIAPVAAEPAAHTAATGSSLTACTRSDALAALDRAPAGLVVTHNDIGAHLAAATHHRALAGPYHRIPQAIITNHRILSATDTGGAAALLAGAGVDYILTCGPLDAAQIARPGWEHSLLAALAAGTPPAYLAPVPVDNPALYQLWRVDRSRLPAR